MEPVVESIANRAVQKDLLSAYVGEHAKKYLAAQDYFDTHKDKTVWNWSAALLGPIWLFYRKLYGLFVLALVSTIYIVVINSTYYMAIYHLDNPKMLTLMYHFADLLGIGLFAFLGMYGTYYYLKKAQNTIDKVTSSIQSETDWFRALSKKGNPTKWRFAMGFAFTILAVLISFLFALAFVSLIRYSDTAVNTRLISNFIETEKDTIPLDLPLVSSDMTRIIIPQVGSIDIPNSMEVQSKAWKQSSDSFYQGMDIPTSDNQNIVIMQKGIDKYCRIIVDTFPGKTGDYEKLSNNYSATKEELSEVTETVKDVETEGLLMIPGMKLLEWYPARLETINGMNALVISYRRQLEDNPPVLVWQYRFQNNDRLHILTFSYRETETGIWKAPLVQSLKSFRVTNIVS